MTYFIKEGVHIIINSTSLDDEFKIIENPLLKLDSYVSYLYQNLYHLKTNNYFFEKIAKDNIKFDDFLNNERFIMYEYDRANRHVRRIIQDFFNGIDFNQENIEKVIMGLADIYLVLYIINNFEKVIIISKNPENIVYMLNRL